MRSKNILPVQVVSASNLMGSNQSIHKAAFEEALHNSIESSLRSPAVAPSSVFSTLFFTLRQSTSTLPIEEDVKPNADQLNEEVNKHVAYDRSESIPTTPTCMSLVVSHPQSTVQQAISALQMKDASQPTPPIRPPFGEHSIQGDGRQLGARPPMPLLTQQQQIEQLQRFKQLQRLHVWQQMQKEQQGKSPVGAARLPVSTDLFSSPPSLSSLSGHSQSADLRKLPPIPSLASPINGMHGNGNSHSRPGLEGRLDRPMQFVGGKTSQGFCKAGKDIKLSSFEHDATAMVSFPFSYALLCLQTHPRSAESGVLIVVAINLKSLPPPNTSAQALSAQCIGCGEKALHTFGQLSDHVGLDPTVDLTSPRLATNSSQLVGTHARFYLVKDPKSTNNLIRGPPILWNKTPEGASQPGLVSPRAMNAPTQLAMRPGVPTQAHMPAAASPLHNAIYRLHSQGQQHPLVSRSLSGTLQQQQQQRAPIDPMKLPGFSQAPDVEGPQQQQPQPQPQQLQQQQQQQQQQQLQQQLQPRRYLINRDTSALSPVDIPPNLVALAKSKPVLVLVCPSAAQLPRFTGDISSLTVTSILTESFKEPLSSIKEQLNFVEHSPLTNDLMLLITIQYVVSLGTDADLSREGLCQAIVQARQTLSSLFIASLKDLKQSNVLSLANFIASTSGGRVALTMSEVSISDAINRCLKTVASSNTPETLTYQMAVHVSTNPRDLQFHLVVSGARKCRSFGDDLMTSGDLTLAVKQTLVSLSFTQLHLFLAGPLSSRAKVPQRSRRTIPTVSSSAADTSPLLSPCHVAQEYEHNFSSTLTEKILNSKSSLNLSHFTSLRFVFVLPPCPALLAQCAAKIAASGVLSEVYKTHHPSSALSSQIIVTMDPSSRQRLTSICKQWEDSSTLLVIIQLNACLSSNYAEGCNLLNNSFLINSKNVVTLQCTTSPYLLLTNHSRVATSNEVYCQPPNILCASSLQSPVDISKTQPTSVHTSISMSFDPQFEAEKWNLLDKNHLLPTSLVACELVLQQYTAALVQAASNGDDNTDMQIRQHCDRLNSPTIRRMIQDLLSSSGKGEDHLLIVIRIPSSLLATRFHDSIAEARNNCGFSEAFEVVQYTSNQEAISMSPYFLNILRSFPRHDDDWVPTSLQDLAGIPAIVIYQGEELVHQLMPRNLKYVDLRLAFEGTLYRSSIDQELALCQPFQWQAGPSTGQRSSDAVLSPPKKRLKHSSDDDDDSLQVIESEDSMESTAILDSDKNDNDSNTWKEQQSEEKGSSSANRKRERERDDSSSTCSPLDFVRLAMKEADLTSAAGVRTRNAGNGGSQMGWTRPVALLPQNIYERIQGNNQGHPTLSSLPPHPLCTWIDSLHPQLPANVSPQEESLFYRKWSKPAPGHPDFFDGTSSGSGELASPEVNSIDPQRFILVTPPTSDTVRICCNFLGQLNSSLVKQHEVSIYDDDEQLEEIDCDAAFRTLLSNPQPKGQSQIVNSCDYLDSLVATSPDQKYKRKVVTKVKSAKNARPLRQISSNAETTQEQDDASYMKEARMFSVPGGNFQGGELQLRLLIPKKHLLRFIYGRDPDGQPLLRSLRLKSMNDVGIKTPVVSLALHDSDRSLLDLSTTLMQRSEDAGDGKRGEEPIHFVVAKHRDARELEKLCGDSVLIVLPASYDHLGRGAMKSAAQVLFQQFHKSESDVAFVGDTLWPYVLLLDDDCVAWWSWQQSEEAVDNESSDYSGIWRNISLSEALANIESRIGDLNQFAAIGLRPWSNKMKDPRALPGVENVDSSDSPEGNYVSERIVTSCVLLDLSQTSRVTYQQTRFYNEDIDWSLRAASSDLRVGRIENLALATVPSNPTPYLPEDKSKKLVTSADAEFEPLPHHPRQLLETYFARSASSVFTRCKNDPFHPVLCLDCYISLGSEIFVEFTSSHGNAPLWSIDYSKEYGGLLLFCPRADVLPDFLHEFSFVEGATVCVISNDRSSLRHSVVKLNLEQDWHFRLTDEFQTANGESLSGVKTRPLYFLTGVRKSNQK